MLLRGGLNAVTRGLNAITGGLNVKDKIFGQWQRRV
jgi:hypothetical protein